MSGPISQNERWKNWGKKPLQSRVTKGKSIYEVINWYFCLFKCTFFKKLKILSLFLPLIVVFDALLSLFCRLNTMVIVYKLDRHKFLSYGS